MSDLDDRAKAIKSMMRELDDLARDIDSATATLNALRKEHEDKRRVMSEAKSEFLKKAFGDYSFANFLI